MSILSHMNPDHIRLSYFFKNHFNSTLHLRLGFPSGLFPSGFATKIVYIYFLPLHYCKCNILKHTGRSILITFVPLRPCAEEVEIIKLLLQM